MPGSTSSPASSQRGFVSLPTWIKSPTTVVGLLLLSVFLLRLPSALVPRELNPDESEVMIDAMKSLVDPRPWIGIDGGSLGPLTLTRRQSLPSMGVKPGYTMVHMLASVMVCLQVFVGYLALRRLGSQLTAAVGGLLMVLFYGLCTRNDYLHYTGELLPALLLMVGFHAFLVWDKRRTGKFGVQLRILFGCGLALGMAPWCKLQAAPVTAALGLLVLARIATAGRTSGSAPRAWQLAAFALGAVLTASVLMLVVWQTGAFHDFWASYIQTNLGYAGAARPGRFIENILANDLHLFTASSTGAGCSLWPDVLFAARARGAAVQREDVADLRSWGLLGCGSTGSRQGDQPVLSSRYFSSRANDLPFSAANIAGSIWIA